VPRRPLGPNYPAADASGAPHDAFDGLQVIVNGAAKLGRNGSSTFLDTTTMPVMPTRSANRCRRFDTKTEVHG